MLVSLNWLKDFVDIPKGLKPEDLANMLTLKTAEIEGVVEEGAAFENMVVGHVVELKPHPDADKLKIAMTSLGEKPVQIVCGGENLKEGMYVAVAQPGAQVRWHGEGEPVVLEKVKIRGQESNGMICASSEIGLEGKSEGPRDILDLSPLKPKPGMPLAELFEKNDVLFEFDNKSLTHRPDLWGHCGVAREVAAVSGGKFKMLEPKIAVPVKGESVEVKVENVKLCPRYCGLIIENVKIGDSPDWLKKRLKATGHGVHNNIVDVTNYVMHELGQPMHAFDKNFIKGGIVVRVAKKGEKMKTLDGKERTLDESVLVIADHEKPVAIAGVMGGENSEINEKTTAIILESANFQAGSIRKTSVKLGLRTDAVQRFEKSLDPHLAELAIKRAAELILQICPNAKIAGPISDAKDFSEKPLQIKLDAAKTRAKIGVEIRDNEIKKILESLEFVVEKNAGGFMVTVPSHRSSKDVTIQDDLIEEVARMYGYDNIPAELPDLPIRLPVDNTERFRKHRLRELFSYALGFDEVYNYSFYGKREMEKCLLPEAGHVKVLNYLSEDQTHMRVSLIPGIMKNLADNARFFEDVRIYEVGRTYKNVGEYFPLEEKIIGGAIMVKGKKAEIFYEAKGVVENCLRKFGVTDLKIVKGLDDSYAHPVKSLTYLGKNGASLAKVFMPHPSVANNFDLGKYGVVLFEINFSGLMKFDRGTFKYQQIPRFPGIEFDVSVLADSDKEAVDFEEAIKGVDRVLIKRVDLFDVYEGTNIESGKKALAYRITLRADDKTLSDEEAMMIQRSVFKALEKAGGVVRGV